MTAPRVPRHRLTPDEYKAARDEGYSDDEIRAEGYDLPERQLGRGIVGGLAQLGANWGDEIAGGVAAAGAMLPGGRSPGEAYRATQNYVEDAGDEFYDKHKAMAIGLQIGSAAIPFTGGLKALGALKAGSRAAKVLGSAVGAGGVTGALTGAGRGDSLGERGGNAAMGGAVGAGAGAVLSPLVSGLVRAGAKPVNAMASRFRGARGGPSPAPTPALPPGRDKALGIVAQKLLDDGVDANAVDAAVRAAQAGDPEMLLNLGGENTAALARVVQSIPGRGKQVVQGALDRQAVEVPELVTQGVEQAIGKKIPNAQARIDELAGEAARAARPYYEKMEGQVFGDDELQSLLSRPSIDKALQEARRNIKDRGVRTPKYQPENAPVENAVAGGAKPVSAAPKAAKAPNPDQSERGLWLTARTARGAFRKPETVETQGLIDDLIRREELSRRYNYNTKKYGPTSAVTIRNEEAIMRIRDILRARDEIPDGDVDAMIEARFRELFPEGPMGVSRQGDRNGVVTRMEQIGHAKPRKYEPPVPTVSEDVVADALGEVGAKRPQGASVLFEELDNAKKLLDAQIDDLQDLVAKGIDKSVNSQRLLAKSQARDALTDYLDRNTAGQYAEARGVAGKGIKTREAFRSGTGALTRRADDLDNELANMAPEDRAAMLEGAATDLQERVTSRNPTNAANVFDPKARRNLDKITEGSPAQAQIRGTYDRANKLNQQARASTMRGQSTTASTTRGQLDLEDSVAGVAGALDMGRKAVSGNWIGLAADAVRAASARRLRGVTSDVAGEAAEILTQRLGGAGNSELARALVERSLREQAGRVAATTRRVGAGAAGGTLAGRSRR